MAQLARKAAHMAKHALWSIIGSFLGKKKNLPHFL
jgi:hypothetical protein